MTTDGVDLTALAYGRKGPAWDDVHQLIAQIEPGEWTNYGELAQIIGVPAISVGQHIANRTKCPEGTHHIVTSAGTPAEGFRWTDPTRQQSCREVLEAEGINFDDAGRASLTQKVSGSALQQRRKLASTGL